MEKKIKVYIVKENDGTFPSYMEDSATLVYTIWGAEPGEGAQKRNKKTNFDILVWVDPEDG